MKKELKLFVSILLTAVLLYFLMKHLDYRDIVNIFSNINIFYLLIAFLSYIIANFFKSLRLFFLLEKNIKLFDLFNITCIHNMFVGLLPFRSGELSFIFLSSKKGVKKTKSLFSLIAIRFFDLVVIFSIFMITGLIVGLNAEIKIATYLIPLILFFTAGFSIFLANNIQKLKKFGLIKIKIVNYIYVKISETILNLKKLDAKKAVLTLIISFSIWFFNYLCSYLIVKNMNLALPVLTIIHVFTITTILSILPISGIVGFGTTEAIWTISFMLFGVSKELAISTGFSFHIINIVLFTLLGIFGLISNKLFSKKKEPVSHILYI